MNFLRRAAVATLAFVSFASATMATGAPVDVPPALKDWEGWALDRQEFVRCPYVSGQPAGQAGGHACSWPGPLDLAATAEGARFEQQVRVYAPGWVPLPGEATAWPQDVRVDGAPASVMNRSGRPAVYLSPGSHDIAGTLAWTHRPEAVAVPASVGIVRLTIDGVRVPFIERGVDSVRLGAAQRAQESNQFDARIYRKLTDAVPGELVTRVLLRVSGEAREEFLGPLLPQGFTPVALRTALPAHLDPDGRLRVQVRPGTWQVELAARAATALANVKLPARAAGAQGDAGEIWSYQGVDRLRVSAVEGAAAIDPVQADVPGDWQALPAYRLEPGAELRIVERSRGFGGQDLNQISVQRDLWRDFNGAGYTFRDAVTGEMKQRWRLDMAKPYQLQGARAGGQPLLVTKGEESRSGVEIRSPGINLEGTGRIEQASGALPATGWDARLASLQVTLHLPPGERLLAAFDVDDSPSAWLNGWRLLDIFVVLLVAAAAFRVAGWPVAVLAAVALTLAHQELRALTWLFLNALIAIALAQAAPEGRLRLWATLWRNVAFALILVTFVPFALFQARLAFFPQLEASSFIVAQGGFAAKVATAPAPASAPPPVEAQMEMTVERARVAADAAVVAPEQASATGETPPSLLRYAPGTLLQSGPGVPSWDYQSHPLRWSGPVEPTQDMRLVVLGTWLVSAWRLIAVALLALLFVALARRVYPKPRWPWLERWFGAAPPAAAAIVLVVGALVPQPAPAETPTPELLQQLTERLTRAPECAPNCASIPHARINIDDSALEVRLEAHAGTRTVVTLPAAPQRWAVDRVTVDGVAAPLARDDQGNLITAVEPGVHDILVAGTVADANSVRLAFPMQPARVQVSATGWDVAGIDQQRLLADSITLTRTARREATGEEPRVQDEFPPFVRLHRRLALDLDWRVHTTVERIAPEQGAFTLELPLLAGESVLTAGLPVRDGRVSIAMPAGVSSIEWDSTLERRDGLRLEAQQDRPWVEAWEVVVAPAWRVEFKGTPEVLGETPEDPWRHLFEPRPGEALDLSVKRPAAVDGPTVAFERLQHQVSVGQRSTDTTLEIGYRSTQGGRHVLKLPAGARLQAVVSDGEPLALRDEKGELALPLQPGEHSYTLTWQQDGGAGLVTRPGEVGLGAAASNLRTVIAVPESRWVLFAMGGGVGPAILYWAELAVFVVVAVLLGRVRRTPLRTHEWLLVGLGLSTFSWSVLLLFAAWVFALEWRRSWTAPTTPLVFNVIQVGLALLTVCALGSLVSAIPNGLLGTPDMRIDGIDSSAASLAWFHDRIEGALPRPMVISVSIWFYKGAMLGWALWLSFALVRWVRWAWEAFTAQGLWASEAPVAK